MNKTRLEAFSDGVFAIIITIMVLELKSPRSAEWSELTHEWPVFLSYTLSFIYVGIYWGNHHHLFHAVRKIDGVSMWLNLNLLFWLSLVPVATDWMGENHFAPNTLALYTGLLLVVGLAYTVLQIYLARFMVNPERVAGAFRRVRRKGIISAIAYIVAIPFAYIAPAISGGILIAVAAMWLLPDKALEKALE